MRLGIGFGIDKQTVAESPPFVGPLDDLTSGLEEAHAVHKLLLSAYEGPLIRVRADRVGQPEEDISPLVEMDENGDRLLDVAALLAFAAGDSCYLVTVYDELGSADKTQATSSLQPRIVDAGVVDEDSLGNVMARFDGSDDALAGDYYSDLEVTIAIRGQARVNGFWAWTGAPSTGDLTLCFEGTNKLQGLIHNVAFYGVADSALSLDQSYVMSMDSEQGGTASYHLDGVDDGGDLSTPSWSRLTTTWGGFAGNSLKGGVVASAVWSRRLTSGEQATVADAL